MNKVMDILSEVVDGVKDETFYVVVAEFPEIDYALVRRNSSFEPWIAVWHLDKESKSWGQGHCFETIERAMMHILDKQIAKRLREE